MSGNLIAQGFLFRQQEPDTREHPNRQPDRPTLPRKDRVEASFDSINPSSLKEMSGNWLLSSVLNSRVGGYCTEYRFWVGWLLEDNAEFLGEKFRFQNQKSANQPQAKE